MKYLARVSGFVAGHDDTDVANVVAGVVGIGFGDLYPYSVLRRCDVEDIAPGG